MRWNALAHMRLSEVHVGLIAVILLCLFGMFNASQQSRAPSVPAVPAQARMQPQWHGLPDYNSDPEAGARMIEQLCRKANGDPSKLSDDELKWLNAVSAGNGVNMVIMKAQQYKEEQKRAHKRPKEKSKLNPGD